MNRKLVAGLAALAAITTLGPAAVYGAGLITGADIKNGSVTTKDVKNASLLAKDFKPGQLPSGEPGLPSTPGPQGEVGPSGPPGPSDAFSVHASSTAVVSTAFDAPTVIATLTLPAGSYVVTTTGLVNNAGTSDIWCYVGLVASQTRWITPSAGSASGYMDHIPFSIVTTASFTATSQIRLIGVKNRAADSWTIDQAGIVAIKVGDLH